MKYILILGLTILLVSPAFFSQDLTGKDIIEKVNAFINVSTSYSKSKMTITTSSGQLRTFISDSWSKDNGKKNLVRYLEPTRIKGQAILMLNNADDIWMFNPRTQRVRKLASHQKKMKIQGSDFSYEDMGGGDMFIKEYSTKRLTDEKKEEWDCYTLELTPKEETDASYGKLILWVVKENYVPVVIDYYDENAPDRVLKTLVQSDIKVIDGIYTAMKFVMINRNDNTQTEIEMLEVKFNIELEDSMFTERELKK